MRRKSRESHAMNKPIRIVRELALEKADYLKCNAYLWLMDSRNVDLWRRFESEANRTGYQAARITAPGQSASGCGTTR